MTIATSHARWVILRCSNAKTLVLADSLAKVGYEAWSPMQTETKRVPRANVKRKFTTALLPSYVFVPAQHLAELFAIINAPVSPHPSFRILREFDRIPLIADTALAPLRRAERYHKPLERGLSPGEKVRLTEGAFAGCNGVVQTARGKFAMVVIPGFRMPLKIAEWHLLREESSSGKRLAA